MKRYAAFLRGLRIVSLLPSATEIICGLGLEAQLVGVTHECDYPASVRRLPKVTRTLIPTDASSREIDQLVVERLKTNRALYTLDLPTLERLRPDLIVTQTLCNVCAVAEEEVRAASCRLPSAPRVIHLEPQSLSEVLDSVAIVGAAAGAPDDGAAVVAALRCRVDRVRDRSNGIGQRPRVALLEWLDPPFCCGHWSPEIVRLAGGVEGLGAEGQPSRRIEWSDVVAWQPDAIAIACCGFGVDRTLRDVALLDAVQGWSDLPAVRSGRVFVVDGSHYFSRPGPRLVDSLEILAHALHPDIHPLPAGLPPAIALKTLGVRQLRLC